MFFENRVDSSTKKGNKVFSNSNSHDFQEKSFIKQIYEFQKKLTRVSLHVTCKKHNCRHYLLATFSESSHVFLHAGKAMVLIQ